jgi:hypothetical protein
VVYTHVVVRRSHRSVGNDVNTVADIVASVLTVEPYQIRIAAVVVLLGAFGERMLMELKVETASHYCSLST